LLASAQAHAALQRKAAETTRAMAAAKQQLLERDTARAQQQERELAALRASLEQPQSAFSSSLSAARAKAEQVSSASLTREVIERLTQPNEAGAVWRSR
jgi:hypothetical protein